MVSIAALKPYKGLSVLLEACRILRDRGITFGCEIIGEGPLREELEETIDRCGLFDRVRLRGALPQHQVARSIAASSLVVLPSVIAEDGQMEGIPVALMEAMAAARPVVASALSGIPELIENGVEGLLTRPGDEWELAGAIQTLLASPPTARAMGSRGRQRVLRDFDLVDSVTRLLEPLDESHGAAPVDLESLLDEVALAELAGSSIGLRRVHHGRDSRVVELLLAGGAELSEVVLKTHRSFAGESRPAGRRARDEFERLQRLRDHFERQSAEPTDAQAEHGVPRPLQLMEESSSLLMESCHGELLVERIRRCRGRLTRGPSTDCIDTLCRVGGWLRIFQRLPPTVAPSVDLAEYLDRKLQESLKALDGHLNAARVRRYRHHLEGLRQRLDPRRSGWVVRHGDFWPGNVFVEGDRVEVIDFEGLTTGLPYEDVADFLVHLELFFTFPGMRRRGQQLARAFLAGYLANRTLEPILFRFCRSLSLLRLLARKPRSGGRDALATWRRHRLLSRVTAA